MNRKTGLQAVLPAVCALLLLLFSSGGAGAEEPKLSVVATLPVLKDFVEQVGQNRVTVTTLLSGMESEHTYTPKPSDILSLHRARILVQVGLGLEVWVKGLVANADNPGLLIVTTSHGIPLIREEGEHEEEVSGGAAHEGGNPHIWLDPENAKTMVRQITEGLIKKDPGGKPFYLKNQGAYLMKLDLLETTLLGELKPIKNRGIITQHPAWPYFARRFGFHVSGTLIAQVGAEPSALQVESLVKTIRKEHIRVIVAEPQLSDKAPRMLAAESGIKVVVLSPLPGNLPGTETYLQLTEYNVRQLIEALKE